MIFIHASAIESDSDLSVNLQSERQREKEWPCKAPLKNGKKQGWMEMEVATRYTLLTLFT